VLNELMHFRPWFNRHSFYACPRSVVWSALLVVWSRMIEAVDYTPFTRSSKHRASSTSYGN